MKKYEMILKRFLRVFIFSLIPILPAIPLDYAGVKTYYQALAVAFIIAFIAACDKFLREYFKKK